MMLRLLTLCVFALPLPAQTLLRFHWKPGETHHYRVRQETTITETIDNATTTTRTRLTLEKSWTVSDVKSDGVATLTLSITAFRQEITRPVPGPDGKTTDETLVIDSATPEGAQATATYLNKPILTASVDVRGRVSDVKSLVGDGAARLQAELPFRVELPESAVTAESKWDRAFTIRLDPPAGTGETHDAQQAIVVDSLKDAEVTLKLTSALKNPPKEIAELQPLLPWLWDGTVTFDPKANLYRGSRLTIKRAYDHHRGAGSKFVFESSFEESRLEK